MIPAVSSAQIAEEKLEGARQALADFDDYFVRDGGRWTSPNPDYEAGSDQPPHYGLEFERKLDGWAITTRIFGIREDGSEIDYWEIVTAWDAKAETVAVYQFGRGGAFMVGTGHTNPDGTLEVVLHGTGWDGLPIGYRDVFHLEGPDRFVIDAYHPDEEGELKLTRSNAWTREKSAPGAGGGEDS